MRKTGLCSNHNIPVYVHDKTMVVHIKRKRECSLLVNIHVSDPYSRIGTTNELQRRTFALNKSCFQTMVRYCIQPIRLGHSKPQLSDRLTTLPKAMSSAQPLSVIFSTSLLHVEPHQEWFINQITQNIFNNTIRQATTTL